MSSSRRLKRQIRDQNQNVCVSNATNSRSPNDLKSRIFIGNLNTSVITKRHLQLIFIQFGQIKAISMHKGYAFIQFEDQMDAINAVLAQDGQMIAGQAIDVNLVTEPKPHQKSSKTSTTSNGSETSGEVTTETNSKENSVESDVNYRHFDNSVNEMLVDCDSDNQRIDSKLDSNSNSNLIPEQNSLNVEFSEVQTKKVKLDVNPDIGSDTSINNEISSEISKSFENGLQCSADDSSRRSDRLTTNADIYKLINSFDSNYSYLSEQNQSSSSLSCPLSNPSFSLLLNHNTSHRLSPETLPLSPTQVSIPLQNMDLMICGTCRTLFTSLSLFIRHKQSKCRLRFVCHCHKQ